MLVLLGHLLLHVGLESAQDERPEDLVEAADEVLVVVLVAFDHALERVGEPVLELAVGGEDVRHEEVHERPELHEVVLERGAGEEEAALGLEVEEGLPALGLEVLDVLGLVKDEVLPLLASEGGVVLDDELVAGDADVEGVGFCPALERARFLRNGKEMILIAEGFQLLNLNLWIWPKPQDF